MPDNGAMPMVAFNFHNAMTRWDMSAFPLAVLAVVLFLAVWYLRADWALALRGRSWSRWRCAAFLCGLLMIELAFGSSIAVFAGTYFQAHVIQHLLLMVVAPPLLALGAPSTLLLQTARRQTKERWLRTLRSGPASLLTHPLTAWLLYYGIMFAFFLTSLINVAMDHMALMDVINVVFLLGGTLFWWPMVGIDPIMHWKMSHGARMFNILLGGGVEAFLGVAILNDSHPVASMYTLASTHSGGALLWVSTEFVSLAAFVPIYFQWMRSEDRIAARSDLSISRDEAARDAATQLGVQDSGERRTAHPERLTAWEAAWLDRTGALPSTVAPLFASGKRDPGTKVRPRFEAPLYAPTPTGSEADGAS